MIGRMFGRRTTLPSPPGGDAARARNDVVLAAIGRQIEQSGYRALTMNEKVIWNGASLIELLTLYRNFGDGPRVRDPRRMYDWNGAIALFKIIKMPALVSIAERYRDVGPSPSDDSDDEGRERFDAAVAIGNDWAAIWDDYDLDAALFKYIAACYRPE
jgi:hypothetical protein